ncbi:MAG: hypothetical protein U0892_15420 [Pirellulales bacterium]
MMETSIATVLTGILLVTGAGSYGFVSKTLNRSGSAHKAAEVAQLLLVEIAEKPFEEVGTSTYFLGTESGESLNTRSTLDDVDDYNGLSMNTITDRDGNAVPGTTGWRCSINVSHVTPSTFTDAYFIRTGLKRIDVTITDASGRSFKYSTSRSTSGPLMAQAASASDVLQTSVDISGSAANLKWSSTARLNNQQIVDGSGTKP